MLMRILALTVAIVLTLGADRPAGTTPTARYLDAARAAAAWIRTTAIETPVGRTWPADPADPKTVGTSLYAGSPGVVLFFLELARDTGDRRDIDEARRGADALMAALPAESGSGLWEGIAGIGFVLQETAKATGEPRYAEGVRRVVTLLTARARGAGAGVEWSQTTDIISGSAGTGLFLLYAARELHEPALVELASKAGDRLIELARREGTGLKWAMDPAFPRLMPNFSHGTAGVAYFLASLYGETHQRRFLDAALAGARYLQSVAVTEGDVCLIFHDEPDGRDLFYLGWCHGPVGTARLFARLHQVTGDRTWLDWMLKSARALRVAGIPEKRTPGFWNNVGQCCGSAGVADFFLAVHQTTHDTRDLAFARRVLDDVLARAARDGAGLKWLQAEHRTQPGLIVAQTGYMQGAAGIGAALLHLHRADQGHPGAIRFPDSPF
jgi:lantibiotic modifying enzyme